MQAGPVFPLNDRPFPTDRLDRVKKAGPDTPADHSKYAGFGTLVNRKRIVADYPRKNNCDNEGTDKRLPALFVDKGSKALSGIYLDLPDSSYS